MLRAFLAKGAYYLRRVIYAQGIRITVRNAEFRVGFRSNAEFRRARNFPAKEGGYVSALIDAAESASVFWDIGANVGLFSLAAALLHENLRVFAFEPEPLNYERLVDNVGRNGLDGRIVPFRTALGDRQGQVPLDRKGNHSGLGGHAVHVGDKQSPDEPVSVACETADALVSQERVPPPDLVKIDVEGFELQVLRGMRTVLVDHRPSLFLELHPRRLPRFGGSTDEFHRFVQDVSYSCQPIDTSGRSSPSLSHEQEHVILRPDGR